MQVSPSFLTSEYFFSIFDGAFEVNPIGILDPSPIQSTVFSRIETAGTKHFSSVMPWFQFEGQLLIFIKAVG